MKGSFYVRLSPIALAVLDACDYYGRGMIITRVNVPAVFRGMGYGTMLLKQCMNEADRTKTVLFLEIGASDGLNRDQLADWYERHGFIQWKGIYRRRPQ